MKANGTDIYVYYDNKVTKLGCVTSVTEVGTEYEVYDVSTLCDLAENKVQGHELRGQVQMVLKLEDSTMLRTIQREKGIAHFAIGHSDDSTDAFIDSGQFTISQNRSWVRFDGFIVSITWDYEPDSRVMAGVTIQTTTETNLTEVVKVPFVDNVTFTGGIYWR